MTTSSLFFLLLFLVSLRGTTSFLSFTRRPILIQQHQNKLLQNRFEIVSPADLPHSSLCVELHATKEGLNTAEDKNSIVQLVADEEILKFALRLGEIVRESVWECATKFQFRPDQVAVEIDKRVKKEVAIMMGKEEFHLLDFIFALDKIAREMVQKLAGDDQAEYDRMTNKIEGDVKNYITEFTGKENPDGEDIENALHDRVAKKVTELMGMEALSLENVAKEIDKRRLEFLKDNLGEFAADRFNDITNLAMKQITGKETYEFGDITRKIAADLFVGNKKK